MGNVFNAISNLRNNIFGPSKIGVTGAPSSFPPARTPIELAGDQGPLESLNRDPFSSRFLSYPSNLINDVSIFSENCSLYSAWTIKGVKVDSSPEWLSKRLESVGMRSINNIVKIV